MLTYDITNLETKRQTPKATLRVNPNKIQDWPKYTNLQNHKYYHHSPRTNVDKPTERTPFQQQKSLKKGLKART